MSPSLKKQQNAEPCLCRWGGDLPGPWCHLLAAGSCPRGTRAIVSGLGSEGPGPGHPSVKLPHRTAVPPHAVTWTGTDSGQTADGQFCTQEVKTAEFHGCVCLLCFHGLYLEQLLAETTFTWGLKGLDSDDMHPVRVLFWTFS